MKTTPKCWNRYRLHIYASLADVSQLERVGTTVAADVVYYSIDVDGESADHVLQQVHRLHEFGAKPYLITVVLPGCSKESLLWVSLDSDVQRYAVSKFRQLREVGILSSSDVLPEHLG